MFIYEVNACGFQSRCSHRSSNWLLKCIRNKRLCRFVIFDIKELHPSIRENLLKNVNCYLGTYAFFKLSSNYQADNCSLTIKNGALMFLDVTFNPIQDKGGGAKRPPYQFCPGNFHKRRN